MVGSSSVCAAAAGESHPGNQRSLPRVQREFCISQSVFSIFVFSIFVFMFFVLGCYMFHCLFCICSRAKVWKEAMAEVGAPGSATNCRTEGADNH